MTEAPDRAVLQRVDAPDPPEAADQAWYLYGIIRAPRSDQEQYGSRQSRMESALSTMTVEGIPLQLVECGDLAAVVRPVPRHEFTDESLQERLRDPVALEAMARAHNEVITAIHARQAILPAKFGGVYAQLEDVRAALESAHDALHAQLDRLEGCDEWAVHIYADRATIQQRVATEHPSIRQLREDLRTARPGRAYFLERKLASDLAAATDQMLDDLAQAGYDHLLGFAVAGQVSPPLRSASSDNAEIELLRAAFLVTRADADAFGRAVDAFAADHEGVRCERSGPWPPYSFAAENQL